MDLLILAGGLGLLLGFAVGSFLLVPLPFLIVTIWDAASGPHSADDDIRPIANAIIIIGGTIGLLLGILARKALRLARRPPRTD
jgi:hypothetical protein